jgi:hypothetical protein
LNTIEKFYDEIVAAHEGVLFSSRDSVTSKSLHDYFTLSSCKHDNGLISHWLTTSEIYRMNVVWEGRRVCIIEKESTSELRYEIVGSDEAIVEARLRGMF